MISSPLRYPGGKAKLYPFFTELLKINSLIGSEYCEPYAGGAGLAVRLLTTGFVDRVCINDIDRSIYAFWTAVLRDTERFCGLLEDTPVTVEEWRHQREVWAKPEEHSDLALGFAAYFLNRTSRSGIIEGAGPIGGYDQVGEWKIDVRLPKARQIANIQALARFSSQFQISNLDASAFIAKKIGNRRSFLYLDPPYFVKGRKLYKNFYEAHDHRKIAAQMRAARSRNNWVVSYDDVPEIRAAYATFTPITYSLNYSAGPKTLGTEVIFLSDGLTAPKLSGFERQLDAA